MLIHDNPTLQTAAETLYRLNMDERFRETCERFEQAEIEHGSILHRNMMLTQTNKALTQTNQELTQTNQELTQTNRELTQTNQELTQTNQELTAELATKDAAHTAAISQKDAEISRLKTLLAEKN